MQFLKQHKGVLMLGAVIILIAVGWVIFWSRIGTQVNQAGYEAAFDTIVYKDAYYMQCDSTVLAEYVGEGAEIDSTLLGTAFDEAAVVSTTAGNVSCPAYRCAALEAAGQRDAIIFLKRGETLLCYELTGYVSLGEQPPMEDVCAAYGLDSADAIASVGLRDADGALLDTITDKEALTAFYGKLTALGNALTDREISERYYASYVAEYGENDAIVLTDDGEVETTDDAIYEQAMTFWSAGLCLADIRLTNGLQLRRTVYMPAAGMYTVYGTYALDDPFFS